MQHAASLEHERISITVDAVSNSRIRCSQRLDKRLIAHVLVSTRLLLHPDEVEESLFSGRYRSRATLSKANIWANIVARLWCDAIGV